jgi:hypothetical protein
MQKEVCMNKIKKLAEIFPEHEIPYGFIWVNPLSFGIMENFEGYFRVTDGIHSVSGYFLITGFNREESYYSMQVFSPQNREHCILEANVYFSSKSGGEYEPEFRDLRTESKLYATGVMQILHVLIYGTIVQKPFEHIDKQSWHMALTEDHKRQVERILRSSIDAIVSHLQMFIS